MATIKPPKPKLCKNCGEIFTPRSSIQSTCSPKCANELKRKKDSEKQKSRDEAEAFVESVTGKRPATYSTKDKPVKIRVCRCGKEFPASFGRTACSQRCADEAAMERRRNREESTASNPLAEMRKTSPIPESNELAELRKIDGLRKNSVREVSAETKREVLERDNGRCVVGMMLQGESQNCNCLESVPHHAFYWPEACYDEVRNSEPHLVTICQHHHRNIHAGVSDDSRKYREACKDYLFLKYGKESYPHLNQK